MSTISPSKLAAIVAYRNLLRTQKQVFAGDLKAIQAARKETHSRFMQYKDETNVDILDEKLKLADQVASLLRQNGVKAVREGEGSAPELKIKGEKGSIKFGDVPLHAKEKV